MVGHCILVAGQSQSHKQAVSQGNKFLIPEWLPFNLKFSKEAHTSVAYPPWELKVLGKKVFSSGLGSQLHSSVAWGARPLTVGSAKN